MNEEERKGDSEASESLKGKSEYQKLRYSKDKRRPKDKESTLEVSGIIDDLQVTEFK